MNGVNKVFIAGHLGTTPQLMNSKKGNAYCNLRVATKKNRRNKDGDFEAETLWHNIRVWGKLAESCCHFLTQGAGVAVEGFIDHYKIDSQKRKETLWKTTIVAQQVHFLTRSHAGQQAVS